MTTMGASNSLAARLVTRSERGLGRRVEDGIPLERQ